MEKNKFAILLDFYGYEIPCQICKTLINEIKDLAGWDDSSVSPRRYYCQSCVLELLEGGDYVRKNCT